MNSREFLDTSTLKDALEVIRQYVPLGTATEELPLHLTLGRIIATDINSPEDLPSFSKSTVDGFAVKAADTFGASEGTPLYLEVVGEVVIGSGDIVSTEGRIEATDPGKWKTAGASEYSAIHIPTGGVLPPGTDSVVMIEYTQPFSEGGVQGGSRKPMIEVSRAVSPGENVIQRGEDICQGDTLFHKGHLIMPQDIGVFAGLGIIEVELFRRPRVAIISTGPEICPIDQIPLPGQVRDINAYTLAALVLEAGGEPMPLGICADDLGQLKKKIQEALDSSDCVLISGGSSVGTRDFSFQAISDLGPPGVLIHGLSIRPGKPTIIGQAAKHPIIGLPGHPASAMIVGQAIVCPIVQRLAGLSPSPLEGKITALTGRIHARLTRNIPSQAGKEDFIRVALSEDGDEMLATPLFGKSGLISPFIKAHGIMRIPADAEGAYEGEDAEIEIF